jgi:phenylalanyl-tRNA synthetase beta subunit
LRRVCSVRLFEIGHTFWRDGAGRVGEADSLAIVVGGKYGSPWTREVTLDLFDAKGAAELVAESLGVELVARRGSDQPGLDPDSAATFVDSAGAVVGFFGRVADDEDELFVAELRLDRLAPTFAPPRVVPPGRFPAVDADLTLGHRREVTWAEIEAAIAGAAVADLVGFAHKDRYLGPGVAAGTVNTTISFRYQSSARSLTQDEVNERQLALADDLRRRFAPAEEK